MPEKDSKITELYVGAFTLPHGETIISGIYADGEYQFAQATVEHTLNAVPSLIRLCNKIQEEKGWSWRLLKFSRDGINELDKQIYQDFLEYGKDFNVQ